MTNTLAKTFKQDNPFQMYTCAGICVYNGMGFINEDGWPSIPRINEYLGSVVEGAEANQWEEMVLYIQ